MVVLAGIEVQGISVGGLETCIDLPGLRVAFDIGRAPDHAVARPTILFTHAHMDHMGGVAHHCATRALRRLAPPTYVVGPENEAAFRDLFDVWRRLDRSELPHELVVIGPGEEHVLGKQLVARAFRSPHRAPCQGYGLWQTRTRRRADLAHETQDELRARSERGEAVTEVAEVPLVAFPGDTLIEVVEREEVVRKAKLLILEVTFLDERVPVEECRSKGHVHLDEVCERADLFQNEAILVTHLSQRYSHADARAIFARRLPASLRERVVPFLPE